MRKSKYGNKKITIDGIKFDSIGEGNRYTTLKLLERNGAISDLKMQQSYRLEINKVLIARYIADFTYNENGKFIVEDFKGVETGIFKLKKKLMKALYGIDIRITKAR